MMLFTHVLAGMVLGTVLATALPVPAMLAAIAGGVGGIIPDLDMAAVHRRTLHAPLLQTAGAGVALGVAVITPSAATGILASFTGGMALHSLSDVMGGGKELRPWERTDDRAVYCHATGSWWRARRLLYDGSPADLVVALGLGTGLVAAGPAGIRPVAAACMVAATGYTVLRRPIVAAIPARYGRFDMVIHELLGLPDAE